MTPYEAILTRHSVREYTQQSVPRESIERILEAARHAPCSCNLQLMRYVVIDDPKLRDQLTPIVSKKLQWAPINIFFFIDPRFNRHRSASIMGLGAAMQNMALVAHQEGLASCPMAGFEGDDELKKVLGVPDFYEAILNFGLGYPKKESEPRERSRIPLEEIVDFNRFDQDKSSFPSSPDLTDWNVEDLLNYRRRIAPVYRYQDRFALQSFNRKIYNRIFEKLKESVKDISSVLDLHTYDGYFLKLMHNAGLASSYHASDFLDHTLNCVKETFPKIETHRIDRKHLASSVASESQDLVTCVHKVGFIPDVSATLQEALRVLKAGGQLFLSSPRHSPKKEAINVYDGNPFYKIGPHRHRSMESIEAIATELGFKKISSETENHEYLPGQFHDTYYLLYKKA